MTFPNPFESNPIPGLQGVAESIDLDSSEVQRVATALYQGALTPLEQDKRKLATIKGGLVKPAAASIKAQDSRTLTEIAQRLRQHAEAQVADGDAELMLLASRLGARQSAGELVPIPPPEDRPTKPRPNGIPPALPVQPPPPTGGIVCVKMNPFATPPIDRDHPPDARACWTVRDFADGEYWCCQEGGDGGPPPPSPPPPPPPPPPPYCEPCPVGVPPGGTLPHDPAACRKPAEATPQAVYIVPWLGADVPDPSVYSECGRKAIDESFALQYPASRLIAAFQPGADYDAVLHDFDEGTVLGFPGK